MRSRKPSKTMEIKLRKKKKKKKKKGFADGPPVDKMIGNGEERAQVVTK